MKLRQQSPQEEELLAEDNSGDVQRTTLSMACSHCYTPYDLQEHTPYTLTCDHSACKQCLRQCHKSKSPFVCSHDSVVVPLPVIKTLSKNIEVIRTLREREAQEKTKVERRRLEAGMGRASLEESVDNKGKGKEIYIDVSQRYDDYFLNPPPK
jgi:hypothetical protein